MQPYVLKLREIGAEDGDLIGGKARRLADLIRAGLPVPDGFVITIEAYREHMARAAAEPECQDIWSAIHGAYLNLVDRDAGVTVAVRSSAASEDEVGSSYAGQYDTFLGVRGWEALVEAILACWGSLEGEKAQAYSPYAPVRCVRKRPEHVMAVIVQVEVPAEVSGVLFTLNPQSGRETEMLVEASWGLGEAVVGGLTNPDRFVLDTLDETVRDVRIGDKKVMVITSAGEVAFCPERNERSHDEPGTGGSARPGAREVPVPEEMRQERTLDDEMLFRLMRLGQRIQEEYGLPQDVEWAYSGGEFFILQARPLTAFSFAPDFGQWTSANFREVMPGFASYLSQSMSFHHDFARAMDEVFRRIKLFRKEDEGTRWAATFFGHGYWNVGAAKRVAARVPGFKERSFDRTVGITPSYEGDGAVTPWTLSTIASALPSLFALKKHYRLVIKEASDFISWFDRNEEEWNKVSPGTLDDDDLATWARFGIDLHWWTNRWALIISFLGTQAQDDFHLSVDRLNRLAKAGKAVSEARLLTGVSHMATAGPLVALWELARYARDNPAAMTVVQELPTEELAALFRGWEDAAGSRSIRDELGDIAGFWERFRDYVLRFRYMSEVDEDLAVPRWIEDVTLPLAMLKACLSGELGEDPQVQLERQQRVREDEERKAIAVLRSRWTSRLNPMHIQGFRAQLELVRRLCWWREETRVYLSRARYQTRRFLKEQGKRWAGRGVIEAEDDVFWMSRDEVLGLLDGAIDPGLVRDAVRKRRYIAIAYRNFVPPPVIMPGPARVLTKQLKDPGKVTAKLLSIRKNAEAGAGQEGAKAVAAGAVASTRRGDGGARNGSPAADASRATAVCTASAERRTYVGLGCSAGVATGVVRVVCSLDEAGSLRKGEVLVAPFANPGWMPLFNLACAIVLEEGGLLSHSAVVAREYGIPAVLQVEGATTRLHTGDLVVVDGSRGVVEVLSNHLT
ncbi:MAG: PEP/pyruvate-binding domain-containing protein [Bacillota bacterium]